MAFGYYGLAWSVYSSVFARGGDVQFDHLQSGGTPVKNDYNFYNLEVSEPHAVFTVNRSAEKVGHFTFPIDYRVTIPIRGWRTSSWEREPWCAWTT